MNSEAFCWPKTIPSLNVNAAPRPRVTFMKSPLRILHLEDDPHDTDLLQAMLEKDGLAAELVRVDTQEEFAAALRQGRFDLIISDYSLPSYDGLAALALARERRPSLPI